jgi:hypothetical protein
MNSDSFGRLDPGSIKMELAAPPLWEYHVIQDRFRRCACKLVSTEALTSARFAEHRRDPDNIIGRAVIVFGIPWDGSDADAARSESSQPTAGELMA